MNGMNSKNLLVYGIVIIAWMVYGYLTFVAPETSTSVELNLAPFTVFLLKLTIVLPYLVIWLVGAHGILHFHTYVQSIRKSKDGEAFHTITIGLWLLLTSLIVSALIGTVRSWYPSDFVLDKMMTIIANYCYIFLPLVAFYFLFMGSRELITQLKEKKSSLKTYVFWFAFIGLFTIFYLWFVFTNPHRQVSLDPHIKPTYYLSDFLIITTIALPYIMSIILGTFAAINISTYSKHVGGIFYKAALPSFTKGILTVIIGSIFLQVLLFLGTARLEGLSLGFILLILYVLFFLEAVGFSFIARGARKLSQLELTDNV